jgi:hypothetical protein
MSKHYRPTPPDSALPDLVGSATGLPNVSATILAVDPAETSGWSIVHTTPERVRVVDWGATEISKSRELERAIELAIETAQKTETVLVFVTEHSKQAFGGRGRTGRFGVDGFIGMTRAQGVWRRTFALMLQEARDQGQNFKVGRKSGLTTRIQTVEANAWRKDLFGTTRYRDEDGKSRALQRPHWKYLAIKTVSDIDPVLDGISEDAAEAVLIGIWGAKKAKI